MPNKNWTRIAIQDFDKLCMYQLRAFPVSQIILWTNFLKFSTEFSIFNPKHSEGVSQAHHVQELVSSIIGMSHDVSLWLSSYFIIIVILKVTYFCWFFGPSTVIYLENYKWASQAPSEWLRCYYPGVFRVKVFKVLKEFKFLRFSTKFYEFIVFKLSYFSALFMRW